jgi:hypothetical protein
MKAFTFRVVQHAYDENGKSLHAQRNWLVHAAGLKCLRAEMLRSQILPGAHSTPPYQPDDNYMRYLIIINGDDFWWKRYSSHLAPSWVYHHTISGYLPFVDFYYTPNHSELFYLYFASSCLLARQVSSIKLNAGKEFSIPLSTPVLCPYPHVTHVVAGKWASSENAPSAVQGIDYFGKEVWRLQRAQGSPARPSRRTITDIREGNLYSRNLEGYATSPEKPQSFYYFVTRTRLHLPARRVVKELTEWQGKTVLSVVEGFEAARFTRLEFSNYAIKEVDENIFRVTDKPNDDASGLSGDTTRAKAIRPPYLEPPSDYDLRDPAKREGLKRVRNNPKPVTYRAAFEHFQFEQTLVLALMENIMLWQQGYSLLP